MSKRMTMALMILLIAVLLTWLGWRKWPREPTQDEAIARWTTLAQDGLRGDLRFAAELFKQAFQEGDGLEKHTWVLATAHNHEEEPLLGGHFEWYANHGNSREDGWVFRLEYEGNPYRIKAVQVRQRGSSGISIRPRQKT